jgi:hypothetical protein
MASLEQGFISGNVACGSSVDAVNVKEMHKSGQLELKQLLTVRFLIRIQVIHLLSSLAFDE